MKDIKFRMWDKQTKSLKRVTKVSFVYDGDELKEVLANSLFQSKFELMQYIGLEDINGVEIYEGDVLRAVWMEREDEPQSVTQGQVIYFGNAFKVDADDMLADIWDEPEDVTFEVIGNIYENPELVK